MNLSVLHISDLHRDPANPIRNQVLLDSLERDRDRYTSNEDPHIKPPNLIIVSGNIIRLCIAISACHYYSVDCTADRTVVHSKIGGD